MKKLLSLVAVLLVMLALAPVAVAEQVTKEGTITIPVSSSNTTLVVECFARGVGKPQANEIVKVALFNTNINTVKVDFAVAEYNGAYTTIATQDYTLAPFSYINNAPFYKFSAGASANTLITDASGSTNTITTTSYVATPYMAKTLKISLWQSTTNSSSATTTYTYQIITR